VLLGLDPTYAAIKERDSSAALGWRVAKLRAEWALSDGERETFRRWDSRAHEIERSTLARRP
jgi:hypothetical protein